MSLTRFDFGPVVCDVDIEATRSAYVQIPANPVGGCECRNCLNFAAQHAQLLRGTFFDWLAQTGIDPLKPHEATCGGDEGEPRLYWVNYGVAGRIVPGPGTEWHKTMGLHTPNSLQIYGTEYALWERDPLIQRKLFPGEAFGIEVYIRDVPWVLGETENSG